MEPHKIKIIVETERLIIRELMASDEADLFEMDSDPLVLSHAGAPMKSMQESSERIASIRRQYEEYGSGRFAIVEKANGKFIGCCGLRFVNELRNGYSDFYSLGYRFIPRYWGNGYATEAAAASLEYGFVQMNLQSIFAMADIGNIASRHILKKIGMREVGEFIHEGYEVVWYDLTKENWLELTKR